MAAVGLDSMLRAQGHVAVNEGLQKIRQLVLKLDLTLVACLPGITADDGEGSLILDSSRSLNGGQKRLPHQKIQLALHVGECHAQGDGQLLGGFGGVVDLQKNILVQGVVQNAPGLPEGAKGGAIVDKLDLLGLVASDSEFSCHIHSFFHMFSSAVKPRQYRSAGDAQLVGNILYRAILDVVRHQHAAVVLADEGQLPTEGVQPLGICAVVLVYDPRLGGQLISGYELTAFVLGICPTAVPIAGDAPNPACEIRWNRPLTQGGHDLAGDLGGQILGLGGVAALA